MNSNLKKIIMTALFAALACVATMSIRIPTPGTSGYIHPGDAIVILAGIILGPVYGMLAGGIGSALSDLIGGYFVYVPITLVIKGLVALVSGLITRRCAVPVKNVISQSSLAVSRISYSLPADILSANSSFMEAVLPQVFLPISSRESAD